jgi:hypothetical protein
MNEAAQQMCAAPYISHQSWRCCVASLSALPSKQVRQITSWPLNGKVNYLKERSKGDGYILTLSTLCFLIFVVQISKKQTKKSVG